MIKKLAIYDFDGTLAKSPQPEGGKEQWSEFYGKEYPYKGWWSKPESLDTNVFNIELFDTTESLIRQDINDPNTYVIILTSRLYKLREQLENVLNIHGINVDRIDMKKEEISKGDKILGYLDEFPDVTRIDVYDDNFEREIASFKSIRNQIPSHIKFNIFHADNGRFNLIKETYNIQNVIHEEIERFLCEINK